MASSTHGDEIDDNNLDLKMAKRHEEWMAEYGRVYKHEAEKARRFEIFKKNVMYIEDFNSSGEHSYTLGVNLFADLTDEEFAATYLCRLKKPEEEFDDSINTSCPSRTQGVYADIKRPGTTSAAPAAAIETPPPAPPTVEEAVVNKAEALAPAAEETKPEEPAAAEQVPAEVGAEEKPSPTEEAKVVEEPVAKEPKAEEKLEAVAEETKEDVIEEMKAAAEETAALTVKEVKAEVVKEKNCGF